MGGPPGRGVYDPVEPRLFVTLADVVDGYVVSVRHLFGEDRARNILVAAAGDPRPLGRIQIILQVIEPITRASEWFSIDTASVEAIDDTGRRLRPVSPDDPGRPRREIAGGRLYGVMLEAAGPNARLLTSIAGRLAVAPPGRQPRDFAFRIRGVPLPSATRVFGEMVPVSLEAPGDPLPARFAVLGGADARRVLDRSTLRPSAGYGERQRLLVASGVPAALPVPRPGAARRLRVTATAGPMGAIRVKLSAGASHWQAVTWEGEPLLVVLPSAANRRDALLLRFGRSMALWPGAAPTRPLFPAARGEAGGSIAARVLVAGDPVGAAVLLVRLWRREQAGWSAPREARATVSPDGVVILPNLAPGRYRVEVVPRTMRSAIDGVDGTAAQYAAWRTRRPAGSWRNTLADGVVVRPGQRAVLPPVEWVPAASLPP